MSPSYCHKGMKTAMTKLQFAENSKYKKRESRMSRRRSRARYLLYTVLEAKEYGIFCRDL